jgi:hypothetical protein
MVGPKTEVKEKPEGEEKQEPGKPGEQKPAVNPDVLALQQTYERANNELRTALSTSEQQVSVLTLKVDNLTDDIETGRLFGDDVDGAKAHRDLTRAQNELKREQGELARANRVLEAAEMAASKRLLAIQYGVEEADLKGDSPEAMELSASIIARARDQEELGKLRKGVKTPKSNAFEDGEGRTVHKNVVDMTTEEFVAHKAGLTRQAEARKA